MLRLFWHSKAPKLAMPVIAMHAPACSAESVRQAALTVSQAVGAAGLQALINNAGEQQAKPPPLTISMNMNQPSRWYGLSFEARLPMETCNAGWARGYIPCMQPSMCALYALLVVGCVN